MKSLPAEGAAATVGTVEVQSKTGQFGGLLLGGKMARNASTSAGGLDPDYDQNKIAETICDVWKRNVSPAA